jgi:transglutaminase-like putative cysteine protease
MLLRISHTTRFEYDQAACDSHNELRIRPWDGAGQHCVHFDLTADQPAAILAYRDFFGNHAHSLSVSAPHHRLAIVARSLVERVDAPACEYSEVSFREFLGGDKPRTKTYLEFLNPSRYIPFSERLRKFFWLAARPKANEDVAAYVMRVIVYVRDQFEYETNKTHVYSSLNDILKSGGGVCQDFAHLTIGLLRLSGVPARYVSGYLTPAPARGRVSELSQQASHAWLEAWLPGVGWSGFDPTHGCRSDERHIGVAIGRDYDDVPPLRGVYRSDGNRATMSVILNIDRANEEGSSGGSSDQNDYQPQQ